MGVSTQDAMIRKGTLLWLMLVRPDDMLHVCTTFLIYDSLLHQVAPVCKDGHYRKTSIAYPTITTCSFCPLQHIFLSYPFFFSGTVSLFPLMTWEVFSYLPHHFPHFGTLSSPFCLALHYNAHTVFAHFPSPIPPSHTCSCALSVIPISSQICLFLILSIADAVL